MNVTWIAWRRTAGLHCCRRHLAPPTNFTTSYRRHSTSQDPIEDLLPFTRIGVRPALARALASSFNVTTPTPLQSELLTLLSRAPKRDLIVRNATGSGKSFALVVGLLNAPRQAPPTPSGGAGGIQPSHLLIVPHADLAHQLASWIYQMVPADLHSHVVARAVPNAPDPTCPDPHILIGTPTRLFDMVTRQALDPRVLGTVALDEVDQLTPPIPRWDTQRAGVRRRHPKPVEVLVAQLAALRAPPGAAAAALAEIPADELVRMLTATTTTPRGDREPQGRLAGDQFKAWLAGKPRVVGVSATASSVVRTHLVSRLKWMHPRRYAFVDGEGQDGRQRVRHCALVVAAGKQSVQALCLLERGEEEPRPQRDEETPASVMDLVSSLVAYARATEVKHALVVVLGECGVNRTVDELNKLYNVRASIWSSSSPPPSPRSSPGDGSIRLDVVSFGGVRGLDMPNLTHVFLLGAPEDVSEYQHIAGRVGRLGSSEGEKDALVVTFCDAKGGERLRQIWRWIGDKRVKVEMVDSEVTEKVKHGGTV